MVNGFYSLETENVCVCVCARGGTEVDVVAISSGYSEAQPACWEGPAMLSSRMSF